MTKHVKITEVSWDVALSLAQFARDRAAKMSEEAGRELGFKPANPKAAAYFDFAKRRTLDEAEELQRFAREIMKEASSSAGTAAAFSAEWAQKEKDAT